MHDVQNDLYCKLLIIMASNNQFFNTSMNIFENILVVRGFSGSIPGNEAARQVIPS